MSTTHAQVSLQELRDGLDRLGLEVTQEELKVLMDLYDVNSGKPSLDC